MRGTSAYLTFSFNFHKIIRWTLTPIARKPNNFFFTLFPCLFTLPFPICYHILSHASISRSNNLHWVLSCQANWCLKHTCIQQPGKCKGRNWRSKKKWGSAISSKIIIELSTIVKQSSSIFYMTGFNIISQCKVDMKGPLDLDQISAIGLLLWSYENFLIEVVRSTTLFVFSLMIN